MSFITDWGILITSKGTEREYCITGVLAFKGDFHYLFIYFDFFSIYYLSELMESSYSSSNVLDEFKF